MSSGEILVELSRGTIRIRIKDEQLFDDWRNLRVRFKLTLTKLIRSQVKFNSFKLDCNSITRIRLDVRHRIPGQFSQHIESDEIDAYYEVEKKRSQKRGQRGIEKRKKLVAKRRFRPFTIELDLCLVKRKTKKRMSGWKIEREGCSVESVASVQRLKKKLKATTFEII